MWNSDVRLPACIPLHANPRGEQQLFLYLGKPDPDGEYPIARYDSQPELWVSEASLIHLIVREASDQGVRIECAFDFERLAKKASQRNALFQERFSDDPHVQAVLA